MLHFKQIKDTLLGRKGNKRRLVYSETFNKRPLQGFFFFTSKTSAQSCQFNIVQRCRFKAKQIIPD